MLQTIPNLTHSPAASLAPIHVRPVKSKRDERLFIRLPRLLYAGKEGYIAPLDMEQTTLLSPRRSPVFKHVTVQYFIAWRHAQPVGRIAAVIGTLEAQVSAQKTGYFGALDADLDAPVVNSLINAAQNWLMARGVTHMRGPITLNCHGESGLMVQGQRQAAMIATPWHPEGLHTLLTDVGLKKEMDLLSFRLDLDDEIDLTSLFPQGVRPGEGRLGRLSIAHLSRNEIVAQGEVLRELYNDAWADTYNFVPMQPDEMRAMISALKPVLRPEHYVQINQDSQPVAMALIVPNIFDLAKNLGPRPTLLGWLKLAGRIVTHRCESARVILLGVANAMRGTILGALLPSLAIAELLSRRQRLGYRFVEMGWILESNTPMLNLVQRFSPEPYKRHRVYLKPLEDNSKI